MKKYLIIITFSTTLLTVCCQTMSGFIIGEKEEKSYAEIMGLYPKNLIDNLPDLKKGNKYVYLNFEFPKGKYLNGIDILIPKSEEQIVYIRKLAEKDAVRKYNLTDENLVIIEDCPYDDGTPTVVRMKRCKDCENLLPIPNFGYYDLLDATDAVVYVLEAEKGEFLETDHLTRYKMELPEDWQHGYSKGIVISRNLVGYWLKVW